ncbi:MAG: hypothetical protein PHI85_00615 [Victivallaceae bacterium]|nr:hypothetical protein [Victivallaceae bacterium]
MIDIHAHVLWGVDDGPKELARSIKMLDLAREDDIDTLFTTSHYSPDLPGKLPEKLAELTPYAKERGIQLISGSEIDYVHLAGTRPLPTLGKSKFILVDMRQPFLEMSAPHVLSQLSLDGYNVIIAHPERLFMEPDLRTVHTLLELDCLFQLNASSIAGRHGAHSQNIAFKIIRSGLAHYVGSDAHSLHRPFYMTTARKMVKDKFGEDVAQLLFEENASQLIAGNAPFKVTPPKRKWWQLFG